MLQPRKWGLFALAIFSCSWIPGALADSDVLQTSVTAPEKTINFRINPANLIFGIARVETDFKVANRVTVGPELGLTMASSDVSGVDAKGFSLGLRANYYFTGDAISTGWYVSPEIGYDLDYLSMSDYSGQTGGIYFSALIGHQWVLNSGFNFNVGAGMTYYGIASNATAQNGMVLATPGIYGWTPTLDISLGFAI